MDRRRRTLLTQETQPEDYCTDLRRCKRAEEDPSVGPPVGECISILGQPWARWPLMHYTVAAHLTE